MNCVFCGSPEATEPIVFPETFTAYQMLQAGDKSCERCIEMFSNPKHRRNCWVIREGVWSVVKAPLSFLEALPMPPFVLYLTKAKRKHGWINAVQNPILNTERFILCIDEEKIFFERQKFTEHLAFLNELWNREIPKGVLLNGYPPAGLVRKFGLTREECQMLEKLQDDRLWRFVVVFQKREGKKENES